MVAYNFKSGFVAAIERGDKVFTIRKNGKRRHARKGEAVQLYTGMMRKECRKIITPDPTCLTALPVFIEVGDKRIEEVLLDGESQLDRLTQFASADGFNDHDGRYDPAELFYRFWRSTHGLGPFQGTQIKWGTNT